LQSIRTTTAATMFEGGPKENVLPAKARAVVNFRILPGETRDSVLAHVRNTVDDPQVEARFLGGIWSNPSPVSDTSGEAFGLLARVAKTTFPSALVIPSMVLGATDARHYAHLSNGTFRFVPNVLRPEDTHRIHGTNERQSVEGVPRAVGFYVHLLQAFCGAPTTP